VIQGVHCLLMTPLSLRVLTRQGQANFSCRRSHRLHKFAVPRALSA